MWNNSTQDSLNIEGRSISYVYFCMQKDFKKVDSLVCVLGR